MNRRKRLALGAAVLALVAVPGLAGAAPFTPATVYEPISFMRFCADSQGIIANLDQAAMDSKSPAVTVGGSFYSDFDSFVASKSSVDTTTNVIEVVGYVTYRDPARTEAEQIRCKYRTGESLTQGAWPPGQVNNPVPFDVEKTFGFGPVVGAGLSSDPNNDGTCAEVNQRTIDTVWDSLSPADQLAAPYKPVIGGGTTLVTEPDTVVETGAEWTQPYPTLKLQGPNLVVPSKALVAPTTAVAPTTGIDSRFGGAHYCTLVSPDYLRDILLGTATVA